MQQASFLFWRRRVGLARLTAVLAVCSAVASPALLAGAAPKADPAGGAKWTKLFDGKSLGKWVVAEKYDFMRHGKVHVSDGRLVLEAGSPGTAVRWTGKFPKMDYDVTLEGMRVEGGDFFCGMTFPVGDKALTLIMGGWGGRITGLSSIDGEPAAENETCGYVNFEQRRWYRIRLRVTKPKVEVWLDKEKIIDLETKDRKLSILWVVEPCLPFGVATWRTTGALRDIRVRSLSEPP